MKLQEIIREKDYWFLRDKNYIIDDDWINEYKEPAPYPAFKWWDQYVFRTLRYYFKVVIREHTEEKMKEQCKSQVGKLMYNKRYTIIICGAESKEIPLPIEIWEENSEPWKGCCPCANIFYFGEKYKELETKYVGVREGIYSTLINGFNDLYEAKEFLEMWKQKIINDHKKEIEIDKKILDLIKFNI